MKIKIKLVHLGLFLILIALLSFFFYKNTGAPNLSLTKQVEAKFNYLSKNGNSSCSSSFRDSISTMPDDTRLQGSCCSLMDMHRYTEQVTGLEKYKNRYCKHHKTEKQIDQSRAKKAGRADKS